ncbi:hypothetical protein L917_04410 [Phytophthora nicotianae]|nr:hypothetical protein L915_04580 [Phytophthora nicotianae]ETL45355.1 hypothetical protein L916_04534 [Phytophthora nicotianae]ETL98537.1 hypothetical protein L917_04410 [Phytophthora nicotianae]ETM51700.1 hypothetical protein L914_04516 [Phytophthora nicotianae]
MSPPTDTSIYDKQLAWKQHGQRKLVSRSHELRAKQEHECTFSPKINSRSMRTDDEDAQVTPVTAVEAEAALLHPTESQETSIHAYLARQEKAREQAQEALHKLNGVQQVKDFTKVTTVEPFTLSSTNWKPRQSTIESPEVDERSAKQSNNKGGKRKTKTQTPRGSIKSPPATGAAATSTKDEEAWESERATLISIIDAQRRELALREQAQQEAVRVAERFATATQAFEERLVAVEQSAAKELEEVKRLLASQAAATDVILTSLGIARRPGSSSNSRYD